MDVRRGNRITRLVAPLVLCALAVGCSVDRVPAADEAASGRAVDTPAPEPDQPPGPSPAPQQERQRTDEVGQDRQDQQQQAPPALTFGMPDFPGTVTGGVIADALAEACGTPEPCVEYELLEEHHEVIPEGRYIRSDPPVGSTVTEGDTVTIWRSLGKEEHPSESSASEGQTEQRAGAGEPETEPPDEPEQPGEPAEPAESNADGGQP